MRIIVTGASGFIGKALCAALLQWGHEVGALVRRPGSEPPGTRAVAVLPVQTPYGRSKQDGERRVPQAGLPAVVIRPSHVYGPGGWYANELVPRLRLPGRFAVIGRGENLWDVVHVEDVVGALALAAERAAPGSIYHVVADEPMADTVEQLAAT
jgi:nucleoside-diphosphate-sugar epimerase